MLSDKQYNALGLGSVICQMNEGDHTALTIHENNKANKKIAKRTLKRDWEIKNRKDLLEELESLSSDECHSAFYWNYHCFMLKLPVEKIAGYINSTADNEGAHKDLQIIANHRFDLRKCGITAWDAGRYVFLCRYGALIGYLTDSEAWELILQKYDDIKEKFDSWEQFFMSYGVGRLYWRSDISESSADEFSEYLDALLFTKDAPFKERSFE